MPNALFGTAPGRPTRGRTFSLAGVVAMIPPLSKIASIAKSVGPWMALLAFTLPLADSARSGEPAEIKKENPALKERVTAFTPLVAADYERLEKL